MLDQIRRHLKNPLVWQIALAAYWLALFVGTHLPRETKVLPPAGIDKWAHVAAYSVLALLVAVTWQLSAGQLTVRHLAATWLVIVLFAAVDELTQALVGRSASFLDWGADALGAAAGLVLFVLWRRAGTR